MSDIGADPFENGTSVEAMVKIEGILRKRIAALEAENRRLREALAAVKADWEASAAAANIDLNDYDIEDVSPKTVILVNTALADAQDANRITPEDHEDVYG